MLEYNLDDATELISRNIQLATDNMGQVDDDLDFLRYVKFNNLINYISFLVLPICNYFQGSIHYN
jgi:hypothetical protein